MSLHCLDSGGTPAVAGPPERLELHEAGTMPPWPAAAASRAEIKIVNLASEPIKGSHASLDLGMLKARARGRVDLSSLHLSSNGKSVPLVTLADRLLFPLSIPPRTVQTAYLDFTPSTVTEAPQSVRPRSSTACSTWSAILGSSKATACRRGGTIRDRARLRA